MITSMPCVAAFTPCSAPRQDWQTMPATGPGSTTSSQPIGVTPRSFSQSRMCSVNQRWIEPGSSTPNSLARCATSSEASQCTVGTSSPPMWT